MAQSLLEGDVGAAYVIWSSRNDAVQFCHPVNQSCTAD